MCSSFVCCCCVSCVSCVSCALCCVVMADLLSELRVQLLFEFLASDKRYDAAHQSRQWQYDAVSARLNVGVVQLLPLLPCSRLLVSVTAVVVLLVVQRLLVVSRFSEQMGVRGSVARRLQRRGQIRKRRADLRHGRSG